MTEGYDHLHTGSRCAVCAQRIGAEAKPAPVVLPEWVKAVLILTCVFSAVTFVRFVVELGDGLEIWPESGGSRVSVYTWSQQA